MTTMTLTVAAVYENGVFKPKEPVALAEGAEVQLTVNPAQEPEAEDPLADVIGIAESGRTDGAENHDRYIYGKIRP